MADDPPHPDEERRPHADATIAALLSGDVGLGRLDELVRSAAVAAWAPVALVSLITDRQVTASAQRVSGAGVVPGRGDHVALEDSVCVHARRTGGSIRIADARADERVAHIPAVVDGTLGSYLGVPLRADGGDLIGVLCVYDARPRAWSEADEHDLDAAAVLVGAELQRLVAEHAGRVSPDAAVRGPR